MAGVVVVKCDDKFKEFIKKVSLNQEIPIPLVIEIESGNLKVAGSTTSSKYYGEYTGAEINVDGEVSDNHIVVGIINAKRFIRYLTVLEEQPILVKPVGDESDVDKVIITTESGNPNFEVVLSSLVEVATKPVKDDNLYFDIELSSKDTKTIFEVLKLISSEECGLYFEKEPDSDSWNVYFKVGSKYEDRGLVHLLTTDKSPEELSDRFITKLSDTEIFIKYHHKDMIDCFSVVDKTTDGKVSMKLKTNTGLIIQETDDTYTISYGFAPYTS